MGAGAPPRRVVGIGLDPADHAKGMRYPDSPLADPRVRQALNKAVNRDELNRILDKISAQGLASLTPQERLFLSNFVPPDDRPPVS